MAIFRQVLKNAQGKTLGVYEYEGAVQKPNVCCVDHKQIKNVTITTTDVTTEVNDQVSGENTRRLKIIEDLSKDG